MWSMTQPEQFPILSHHRAMSSDVNPSKTTFICHHSPIFLLNINEFLFFLLFFFILWIINDFILFPLIYRMNLFYIIVSTIHLVLMLMASFCHHRPSDFCIYRCFKKRYYNACTWKNIPKYVFEVHRIKMCRMWN